MAFGKKKKQKVKEQKAPQEEKDTKQKSVGKTVPIRKSPFFMGIKPKNRYYFYSDYFEIDGGATYGTILTVLHNDGADNRLSSFWGVTLSLLSVGDELIEQGVKIRFLNQVRRREDAWIDEKQNAAERVVQSDNLERGTFNKKTSRTVDENQLSLDQVSEELRTGASYLDVRMKYMVKAPSLEVLDAAVRKINRELREHFDTVKAIAYSGDQRKELSRLLRSNIMKPDRQFGFTSTEYAGFYNLVTHGIEDLDGEYIGQLVGDINTSAVTVDLDRYKHHVVIGSEKEAETWQLTQKMLGPNYPLMGSDMWGVKLGQVALQRGKRAVHFVFNDAHIEDVGIDMSSLTANVNLSDGDLNMFEVFGEKERELALFKPQLEKIVLMAKLYSGLDLSEKLSAFDSNLRQQLTNFYIDKGMWIENAQSAFNRQSVRLVGLPHKEYPRLPEFVAYLRQAYDDLVESKRGVAESRKTSALDDLRSTFTDMLETSGDLFNTWTKENVDDADLDSRVIYNFSDLRKRSMGTAMAQFINVLGYAVRSLGKGDVVIFHGAEYIQDDIKDYVSSQLKELYSNGVRCVFLYGSIDRMLDDHKFNELDDANYTLINGLSANDIRKYEKIIGNDIPNQLNNSVSQDANDLWYLRRSFENVVFQVDISLGYLVGKGKFD